ncbi:MAG: sigma-54-dependent Fis family transcriptional regulator [Kiritimatiellae bacterium]|nr:sigma-54-dependent Fis family transcriptional regulator [Kiritimatiellia bacterium]
MPEILLLADSEKTLSILMTLLKAEGYDVESATDMAGAIKLIKSDDVQILITDIAADVERGEAFIEQVRQECPTVSCIALVPADSPKTAVTTATPGAVNYVGKPLKVDQLLLTVQSVMEYNETLGMDTPVQLGLAGKFDNIVAESPAMRHVCEMIERVAPTDIGVLIHGEPGTEKHLIAEAVHQHSSRRGNTFLIANCLEFHEELIDSELFGHLKGAFKGAVSNKKGLVQSCIGGTLFLDDVDSLPPETQARLRVLLKDKQFRQVGGKDALEADVRLLGGTSRPLAQLVQSGKFDRDLYVGLSGIAIEIKPLRERREDILPLVDLVLRRDLADDTDPPRLDPQVTHIFQQYAWPGNIAELERTVLRASAQAAGGTLTPEMLPPEMRKG